MHPELERLRALATVMTTAEAALATAYRALRESAAALLRTGDATLAEVSEATGLKQGELLAMLSQTGPGANRPGSDRGHIDHNARVCH